MANDITTPEDFLASIDFDAAALRQKYREERDKRIRPEGLKQYVGASADYKHYVEDPYVAPDYRRDPISRHVDVLIIGGGFSGLSVGARLGMAGIDDILIIDKAGDFGGTWYWNRYPGIQCDIEAYIYFPLLEETGYMPSEKYARGSEIFAHAQRLGHHFGLYDKALFQTRIVGLRWDEAAGHWLVSTNHGDGITARHVIKTNGLLDRPKMPRLPGIDKFAGHTFHTSRWDYGYTGGDSSGGLDKLADKKVAIIGTGATAIQCVPHVGRHAQHLYVIQRTPSGVDLRNNAPTDLAWAATLAPGWQRERRENFATLTTGGQAAEDMVSDGWTDAVRNVVAIGNRVGAALSPEDRARLTELADFRKMNEIRDRVSDIVSDEATAEALKPWYRQFCKRPTFSDEYLPTFNRDNVTLVDTQGAGVDHFTENGVVCGGVEYPIDCIIFATGFEYGSAYFGTSVQSGHPIYGRSGKSLSDEWRDGVRSLHGFYTHDFPNLFHIGGAQSASAFAATHYLEEQAQHIVDVLKAARDRQARFVEPTAEAEAEWVRVIRAKGGARLAFQRECTPGAYNNEGKAGDELTRADEIYGGGPIEFHDLIRRWREDGMPGLTMR